MPDKTFVHSPGEYLRYQVVGTGPHTLVLLHGFAASLRTWDELAPLFPREEYTLHLLDLKGHGDSSRLPEGDYSALHNARIIAAYIRSNGLADVSLIGRNTQGVKIMSLDDEDSLVAVKRVPLEDCAERVKDEPETDEV